MDLTAQQIANFRETVWGYFRAHERPMPWRKNPTAYNVLVSELMLQQTQVTRVMVKFAEFTTRFPDIQSLASASLGDVLVVWSGLGYNRRAKFLHEAAKTVVHEFGGRIPDTIAELVQLPGLGPNTAGAILAYAYEQPVVFIETNIRTVLFHHFYATHGEKVDDKELTRIAAQIFDDAQPRQWYWALMDYGTYLKRTAGGRLSSSKHYKKQSPLAGSQREMRGRILRVLTRGRLELARLRTEVDADERFEPVLAALEKEELVALHGDKVGLTGHTDTR